MKAVSGSSTNDSTKYREALLTETREELQKADSKASILLAASGIAAGALLSATLSGQWTPNKLHHGDARLFAWISITAGLVGVLIRPGNCRDFSSWKRMEHDKEFIAEAIPR